MRTKNTIAIVACDSKRGIGLGGQIPWDIPREMRQMARTTTETKSRNKINALIMGRITYESIPESRRPLRGRLNIVVSGSTGPIDGAVIVPSLREGLEYAEMDSDVESIYIFGGQTVYEAAITDGLVDEVLMSAIDGDFGCDTFFPALPEHYKITSTAQTTMDGFKITHQRYIREGDRNGEGLHV